MRGLFLFFFAMSLFTGAAASEGVRITAEQAKEKAVRLYEQEARETGSGRVPGATKVALNDGHWVVFIVDKVPGNRAYKTYYFSLSGELIRSVP